MYYNKELFHFVVVIITLLKKFGFRNVKGNKNYGEVLGISETIFAFVGSYRLLNRKPTRLASSLQLTYLSSNSFFLHAYQLFSFNWSITSVQPSSHSPFIVSSAYFAAQLPTLLDKPGAVRFRLSKRQSLEKCTRCPNLHFATQASRKRSIPKTFSTGYHFSAAAAVLNYSQLITKSHYMFYYYSRMVPKRTTWNTPRHIHVRLALPSPFPWNGVSLAIIWPNFSFAFSSNKFSNPKRYSKRCPVYNVRL